MEDRTKKEQLLRDKFRHPADASNKKELRAEKRVWKKALHRLQRRNGKIRLDDGSLTSE